MVAEHAVVVLVHLQARTHRRLPNPSSRGLSPITLARLHINALPCPFSRPLSCSGGLGKRAVSGRREEAVGLDGGLGQIGLVVMQL